MMKVSAIELHFENLESVKFPLKDVVHVYFGGIKKQISSFGHATILDMEIAEDFRLHVNARGNVEEAYESSWMDDDDDKSPFTRVDRYPDITSVDLHMEGGTKREIYIDWQESENSCCDNANQSSVISDANGDLFIIVNAKENVYDAFEQGIEEEEPFYRRIIEIKEG